MVSWEIGILARECRHASPVWHMASQACAATCRARDRGASAATHILTFQTRYNARMTSHGEPTPRTILEGRYQLDARLEDWGIGEAWRARDDHFANRNVVVKLLGSIGEDGGDLATTFTQ